MPVSEFFAIAADPGLTFADKVSEMLRVACRDMSFELGILAHVEGDRYEVVSAQSPPDLVVVEGDVLELGRTYCRDLIAEGTTLSFERASGTEWADHPAYSDSRLEAYLGCVVRVNGRVYGTLNLSSREGRREPIDDDCRRSVTQLAHWIGTELERQALHVCLSRSEELSRGVMQTSREGVMVFESVRDASGSITDFRWIEVNATAAAIVNRPGAELIGRRLLDLMPGNRDDGLFDAYRRVVETGERFDTEHRYSHEFVDAWFTISARRLGDGFVVSFSDISELRRAQIEAERTRDELQVILDSVPALVWYKDEGGRVVRVNEAVASAMGLPKEQIEGRSTWELHPRQAEQYCRDDRAVLESRRPTWGKVERWAGSPRDERWMSTDKIPVVRPDGTCDGLLVVSTDITRLKRTEETLRLALERDHLTDLGNRETFVRAVEESLASGSDRGFGIAMLDFDRFKAVNDSLGHQAGDELLCSIAERLRQAVKSSDLVARLGGDEFAMLFRDIREAETLTNLCERVRSVCESAHTIAGHRVVSTSSIGVAHSSFGFGSADSMIAVADRALYAAKAAGRNSVRTADRNELDQLRERADLASRLSERLGGEGLEHQCQPIVSAECGRAVGFEILTRWPGGGVNPGLLFEVAEESNQVSQIALEAISAGLHALGTEGMGGLFAAVKIGRRELLHPAFAEDVRGLIDSSPVQASALVLEIDEHTFGDTRADVHSAIGRLQNLGVRVAIEKFGMGATSLSQLQRAPVDIVKLDRRLLGDSDSQLSLAQIASALTSFTRQLGITVIGEGIETPEQLALLQALDIDLWQGYLASAPVGIHELRARLDRGIAA